MLSTFWNLLCGWLTYNHELQFSRDPLLFCVINFFGTYFVDDLHITMNCNFQETLFYFVLSTFWNLLCDLHITIFKTYFFYFVFLGREQKQLSFMSILTLNDIFTMDVARTKKNYHSHFYDLDKDGICIHCPFF